MKTTLITMTKKIIDLEDISYTIFYFSQEPLSFIPSKNEIHIYSKDDIQDLYPQSISYMLDLPPKQIPIFISGERGSGKSHTAANIYLQSPNTNMPYVVIDFTNFTDKAWNYLTGSINSPINSNHITIFFKNIDRLQRIQIELLQNMIADSNLCKRNHVIISYTSHMNERIPSYIGKFTDKIGTLNLIIEPLRNKPAQILDLANRYLQLANRLFNKNVTLQADCFDLLTQYTWPGNHSQLKRIIIQMVKDSTSQVFPKETIEQLISNENEEVDNTQTPPENNFTNRTLEDIQREIVLSVLKSFQGNQTKAAKSLGISRTTLWRIINR